jgi:hypothetical protein
MTDKKIFLVKGNQENCLSFKEAEIECVGELTPEELELLKIGLKEYMNILLRSRRIYLEKEINVVQALLKKLEVIL